MMRRLGIQSCLALSLCAVSLPFTNAHAALFGDDEARQAILDLRVKVDANQREINARLDQLSASARNQLELTNQIELLKQDLARLRGQIELLTNQLSTGEKRQKDLYADLDARLRKLEPQQITVDGQTKMVDANETQMFEAALALFKNSDFKNAINDFSTFLKRYPQSAFAPAAQYWIGASHYALRAYPAAIAAQQVVLKNWPESARASDAMLNIADSQTDLGDKTKAKKTLELLINKYPDSPAAQLAQKRLERLR